MKVKLAHNRIQGVDCAIFEADARTNSNSARAEILQDLTVAARTAGFKVDKSALAFTRAGRIEFQGSQEDKDLVNYLAKQGVPRWTHVITV